jgi:hypothetical protein
MTDVSQLSKRLDRNDRCAARLASLSDAELTGLLSFDPERRFLWGGHCIFELDGQPVFAKRVPLTATDLSRPYVTANLHQLPMYYHYGVGSLGFGAWREAAILDKTNAWVRDGSAPFFPMRLHQRVLPQTTARAAADATWLDNYAKEWGGSAAVRRFAEARDDATHALVLFFEFVPHTLRAWLGIHQDRAGEALAQLADAIRFLQAHGIAHMDAHFENVLTDGERIYVTDFGLALDREHALDAEESAFLERHKHYDLGLIYACVPTLLADQYFALDAARRADVHRVCELHTDERNFFEIERGMTDHLKALYTSQLMRIDPAFVDAFERYCPVASHMLNFYAALSRDEAKSAQLDLHRLQVLLAQVDHPAARWGAK